MFFDRQSRISNFLLSPKKSKWKNIGPTSYNEVMGTKLVAPELLITFEQKDDPCKLQGSGAGRCFLPGSREFPTFRKDQKNRNRKVLVLQQSHGNKSCSSRTAYHF